MSVPEGKRGKSPTEFLHLAYKINKAITLLFVRDLGIKRVSRDLKTFTHSAKMTPEDRGVFEELCKKYNIDVEAEYPLWLIEHYRNEVLKILTTMCENITAANSIYPSGDRMEYWFNLKQKYQRLAQANCYQLLQVFQNICYVLPTDKNKLMPYVGMIQQEIIEIKKLVQEN